MHELAVKHQAGALAPEEQDELRDYRRIGLELDLLRAKARGAIQPPTNGR
jgi:hypothetical protein